MKKILLIILVILMVSSCVTPQTGLTAYQSKNIHKFSRKKGYRTSSGPKYVRPRKRGHVMDKTVTKQTRKEIIHRIKYQRMTSTN